MKRVDKVTITREVIIKGILRASNNHKNKLEVIDAINNFNLTVDDIYNSYHDGSWKSRIKYNKLEKLNKDGKLRKIDSPDFYTRCLQHTFLVLAEPLYYVKDPGTAYNCKRGYGITASDKSKSLLSRLKHCFYDLHTYQYSLVIDQRKCYEHVTKKTLRKAIKQLTSDKDFIDFGTDICIRNGHLPIGTPTSPFCHHLIMLPLDILLKSMSKFVVRYADDVFIAFETKQEAQQAKWRVKNYMWYYYQIRSKRKRTIIRSLNEPHDFCGYIIKRKQKGLRSKGYTRIRRRVARDAQRSRTNESWGSYFGLLKHADCYNLMLKIQNKNMKLNKLTEKIKINRNLDAVNVELKDIEGIEISIHDYEYRKSKDGTANWIKCLIGIPEEVEGKATGKTLAREFHGNYQGLIQFILAAEKEYSKQEILPLEEVVIVNQCGYIFKDSTNQISYI